MTAQREWQTQAISQHVNSQSRGGHLRDFLLCVILFEPLFPFFQGQIDLQLPRSRFLRTLRFAGSGSGGKSAKVMFTG